MSLIDELISLLTPVSFWLANILEFYHYLSDSLDLSAEVGISLQTEEQEPMTALQSAMVYAFQQLFDLSVKVG